MAPRSSLFLTISVLVLSGTTWAEPNDVEDAQGNAVSVSAAAFEPRSGNDDVPFTRYDGSLFGLHLANNFGPRGLFTRRFSMAAESPPAISTATAGRILSQRTVP